MKKLIVAGLFAAGIFGIGTLVSTALDVADLPSRHSIENDAEVADLPSRHVIGKPIEVADLPSRH